MLRTPLIEEHIPMAGNVAAKLRAITEAGLPARAPESFDALAAVWELGFLAGQQHENRQQQARFDSIRADVTPTFLRRQVD